MRVDSGSSDDVTLPDPGLKLVDLPVQVGASFHIARTDGVTTMEYTSTVNRDRPRIDACGQLIDAFQIDLEGTISRQSAQTNEVAIGDVTASCAIAPQFGGLVVEEATKASSNANGVHLAQRTLNATISSIPRKSKSPRGSNVGIVPTMGNRHLSYLAVNLRVSVSDTGHFELPGAENLVLEEINGHLDGLTIDESESGMKAKVEVISIDRE